MRLMLRAFTVLAVLLLVSAGGAIAQSRPRPSVNDPQDSRDSEHRIQRSDSAISSEVKRRIAHEEGLKNLKIHVTADNGIVTLSGDVPEEGQKHAAALVAERVDGVSSVRNLLHIKKTGETQTGKYFEQKTGDAAITAEVKAKLENDDQLRDSAITVETKDGVVTLNGQVASASLQRRAAELAQSVNKVTSVHSNLKIEPKQEESEQQQQ